MGLTGFRGLGSRVEGLGVQVPNCISFFGATHATI